MDTKVCSKKNGGCGNTYRCDETPESEFRIYRKRLNESKGIVTVTYVARCRKCDAIWNKRKGEKYRAKEKAKVAAIMEPGVIDWFNYKLKPTDHELHRRYVIGRADHAEST